MRAGLRALLAAEGLVVAGEAATLGAALDAAQLDVLLVADAELLGDAARSMPPEPRLALVLLADDPRVVAQLRVLPLAGWAVLPPDADPGELSAAVQAAAAGLVTFGASLAARVLGARPAAEPLVDPGAEPLTGREREVLDLVGQGLSNKLIARQLGISEHTVKFHLSSIFAKLGAASRTDAINRGARQGLITL
jgi:DNA-binding NarL/FixJ family response regulator